MIQKKQNDSNWISVADMMTALMVIFMFIAINYILQIIEYKFVEEDIYNTLQKEFAQEIESGDVNLGADGTIRFNPEGNKNLFSSNSYYLSDEFETVLADFIPKYWEIISSDDYLDYIKEIRIEGHTDTEPPNTREDSYYYNLKLSSRRAASVLNFLRNQPAYKDASPEEKQRMDFLFTSIGYSYGRTLNDDKEYTYLDSNKVVNNDLSRRVEFRIITSNEKLAEEIYQKNEEDEEEE